MLLYLRDTYVYFRGKTYLFLKIIVVVAIELYRVFSAMAIQLSRHLVAKALKLYI